MIRAAHTAVSFAALPIVLLTALACGEAGSASTASSSSGGNTSTATGGTAAGGMSDGNFGFDLPAAGSAAMAQCQGLECQQVSCQTQRTTISGTVYTPSGELPLYNVAVFIPNDELQPLTQGPKCGCEINGEPVVAALTDAAGHFVLENAPSGSAIPLVIQAGEWRRTFMLDSVPQCEETAIPDGTLRLPAKQAEGEMPKIAISTGNADALECLVRKLGIDESEFTTPSGPGKVNFFAGHEGAMKYADTVNEGAEFPPASELWGSLESLSQYDIVLMSCEGSTSAAEKGETAFQAMQQYANAGGRIFASHMHKVWFQQGPEPFPQIAEFVDKDPLGRLTANVVTTFPKGQALASWLVNVGASETEGEIAIQAAQHSVQSENTAYAQRWIASESPQSVQYLSANTPLGAPPEQQCGRVVFSDIHLSGDLTLAGTGQADSSEQAVGFPEGCVTSELTPQEKVLAFMLFDIAACVVPDDVEPLPPIIR
jgi:hypothetical protein